MIQFVSRLGHWGYLVIFLAVALESAAFIGFVIPGETFVLLGGFLAAQGTLDWGDLMVWVCAGAIIGDSIGYEIGRHLGRERLLHAGRWVRLRREHLERVEQFFHRHGGKAVILGRFTAVLRALTPFVAGSSRMRYWKFLAYNATGGIVWGVAVVLVGYLAGASWRAVGHWIGTAGGIVGGLVVLVLLLAWFWRWLIRHRRAVLRLWLRFTRNHRVVAARRRFAPQIAFLEARLTPGGYLGLHLTIGALILIAAGWAFGAVAQDVLAGDPLTVVDVRVDQWLHRRVTGPLTIFFRVVTALGSGWVVAGIAIVVGAWLAWKRRWYWLLELALAAPGIALLNAGLKHVFRRPRPHFAHPLVHLTSYSFPSGHTALATAFYGLLAFFAIQMVRRWKWRTLAVLVSLLLILLIAFSRMYLGAHYLSDVLAAMAEGVAWLAICVTGVETLRRVPRQERGSIE